jgi:hypothetical protein
MLSSAVLWSHALFPFGIVWGNPHDIFIGCHHMAQQEMACLLPLVMMRPSRHIPVVFRLISLKSTTLLLIMRLSQVLWNIHVEDKTAQDLLSGESYEEWH